MKENPCLSSFRKPHISVVILNWNGRHLLRECLDSVLHQQDGSLEVILVDNGSADGSVEFLRDQYGERIRIIGLGSNEGWAGGNNHGIKEAAGEYILLLNNDASLEANFFDRLRDGIRRHPEAGMFTPKILNYYNRTLLDNAGHVIYRDGTARGRGRMRKDGEEFGQEEEVLCPSGAAGVYHRGVFERAGLIDERSLMSVVSETPGEIRSRLRNLEALGHIRRSHDRYALGNQFLSNWLSAGPSALDGVLPPQTSETAMHSALARQQAEELNFLVSKLNARRGQLVELEAVRARDLLAVSPQVLAEIDQLQEEIRQLRNNVDEIRSL